MVHTQMHILLPLREQEELRADFFQAVSSSAAPAHRTRGDGPTVGSHIGAEVGQMMLVQDATAHAPYVQHITDDRRATCRRTGEAQCSPP